MMSEHEQGRKLVAKLKDAVTDYRAGHQTAADRIHETGIEYITLLTEHIAKENTVLFPIANAKLDSNKDNNLFNAFNQLEQDRIGIGKHEEFHSLLDQLRDTYLN